MTTWGERTADREMMDDSTIAACFTRNAGARPAIHVFAQSRSYPLWCKRCGREHEFLFDVEFQNGILATCQHCGDEQVIPYTRSVEVA